MEVNSQLLLVFLIHLIGSIDGIPIDPSFDNQNTDRMHSIVRSIRAADYRAPLHLNLLEAESNFMVNDNDRENAAVLQEDDYTDCIDCYDIDIDDDSTQHEGHERGRIQQLKYLQPNSYDEYEFDTPKLDKRSMDDDLLRRYRLQTADENDSNTDLMQLLRLQSTNDLPFVRGLDYGYMGDESVEMTNYQNDDDFLEYHDYDAEFYDDYD